MEERFKVFSLIKGESSKTLIILVIVGIISGASNALLLVIINKATDNDMRGEDNSLLFISCLTAIGIYLLTKRFVLKKSLSLVQDVMLKIRIRIVNKVRHSELQMVESLGRAQVYARITEDTHDIAQTVSQLAGAFQSAIMVIFSIVYVGILSLPAFLVIIGAVALGTLTYMKTGGSAQKLFKDASNKEAEFFHVLNGILLGFKEIRINQKKNNDVFENFKKVTSDAIGLRLFAKFSLIKSELFSQSYFYLLLVIIIFILPAYHQVDDTSVFKIAAAILFIIGPIESVIKAIPNLLEANIAAENILTLEQKIERELKSNEHYDKTANKEYEPLPMENGLKIQELVFKYPNKDDVNGFKLGPINLNIPKGEITFITGGNGAGKSTFLKALCGLYYPQSGAIFVDDIRANKGNYQNYREMFSIIFSDFFLFDRLYGLDEVDQMAVDKLLRMMRIDHKTEVVDGQITELNLSTGQRKRLALTIAILEDKPLYVFDEVAADQDPVFKKFFYNTVLKQMKDQGKTVIVVTHDDQYFDVADNHYKLADGHLVQQNGNETING